MQALQCVLLLAVAAAPRAARAETTAAATYARTLMMVQDQIVLGSTAARDAVPELRRRLAAEIARTPDAAWKDRQAGRALVVHLLNGGDPRPMRGLLDRRVDLGEWRAVVAGLAALAERSKDAAEQLAHIDARTLDPGVAGQFALTQAIASSATPEKAFGYIALARLLAPGGLVEEAAMRREIELLLAAGRKLEAAQVSARYHWRFSASVYAKDVLAFLAGSLLPELAQKADGRAAVAALVQELPPQRRLETLLSVGRSGLMQGRMEVAAFAGGTALGLAPPESADHAQADVIATIAGAFIAPSSENAALAGLAARHRLSDEDAALVDASRLTLASVLAPVAALPAADIEATPALATARDTLAAAIAALEQDRP